MGTTDIYGQSTEKRGKMCVPLIKLMVLDKSGSSGVGKRTIAKRRSLVREEKCTVHTGVRTSVEQEHGPRETHIYSVKDRILSGFAQLFVVLATFYLIALLFLSIRVFLWP